MKGMIVSLIVGWNILLSRLGQVVGVFFGGLFVGFGKGLKDQIDMTKYLEYKAHMKEKEKKDD